MAILNAVFSGIVADADVAQAFQRMADPAFEPDKVERDIYRICHNTLLAWILIELVININAYRIGFLIGPKWRWNLFDLMVVTTLALEVILPDIQLSFVKVFRVARVGKILQAARFAKFFHGLQKIFTSMRSCFVNLLWAFLTMFLIMYVVGIMMINGVTAFVEDRVLEGRRLGILQAEEGAGNTIEVLNQLYGSFGKVILTLFRSISGTNWAVLAEPLSQVGPFFNALWVMYIGLMLFGIMNIVTGIFVDRAMKAADCDYVVAMLDQRQREKDLKHLLSSFFNDLGKEGSDLVSDDDFSFLIQNDKVIGHLAGIGIEERYAQRLFELLDTDGKHILPLDDVVKGFFQVTGDAKAIDHLLMVQDIRKLERITHGTHDAIKQLLRVHGRSSGT